MRADDFDLRDEDNHRVGNRNAKEDVEGFQSSTDLFNCSDGGYPMSRDSLSTFTFPARQGHLAFHRVRVDHPVEEQAPNHA